MVVFKSFDILRMYNLGMFLERFLKLLLLASIDPSSILRLSALLLVGRERGRGFVRKNLESFMKRPKIELDVKDKDMLADTEGRLLMRSSEAMVTPFSQRMEYQNKTHDQKENNLAMDDETRDFLKGF